MQGRARRPERAGVSTQRGGGRYPHPSRVGSLKSETRFQQDQQKGYVQNGVGGVDSILRRVRGNYSPHPNREPWQARV